MLLGTSATPGIIYGSWVCPSVFAQHRQLTHSTPDPLATGVLRGGG